MERAQGCLLVNHGISRATALAADTDALVSWDAVVISPSFRAAVGREAVIRQNYLHSAKQASRKLSLTGGVSLFLCFRPWQLRDLQGHNPVSVRSQLQRKTFKTWDVLAGKYCTGLEPSPSGAKKYPGPPSLVVS